MNLRPGQIIILAAGAVLVVFSFFTFYGVEDDGDFSVDDLKSQCDQILDFDASSLSGDERDQLDAAKAVCSIIDGASAWNTDLGFPLATWPALIGLAVAGLVAADAFSNFDPPEVAGFSAPQLLTALSFAGALIMFGYLIMGADDGQTFGIGFWFMLLGSIALLVGTVMELLQGPAGSVRTAGGQPGYGMPPGPGGYPPGPGTPGGGAQPPGPPGPQQPPGPDPNAF